MSGKNYRYNSNINHRLGKAYGPSASNGCKIAHVAPAEDIAPNVPHSPPFTRGFQKLHFVVTFEGSDQGCRHGGPIPKGQVMGVDNVQER